VVRQFAVLVLAETQDEEGRLHFRALFGSPDLWVRVMLIERMAVDGPAQYRDPLLDALADAYEVREAALPAWYGIADAQALARVRAAVQARAADQRRGAWRSPPIEEAQYLASVHAADADLMRTTMGRCAASVPRDGEAAECGGAAAVWWLLGAPEAREMVVQALAHPSDEVRVATLEGLVVAPHAEACALARAAIADGLIPVRRAALHVLEPCVRMGIGEPEVRRALRDPNEQIRYEAVLALPPDDPEATVVLVDLLNAFWLPLAADIAGELARRGDPAGLAHLERLVADSMRTDSGRHSTLIRMFPIVNALSKLRGPRVDAMLRRLRGLHTLEGLAATLVLVRRGDREMPSYFEAALDGDRGLEAQLLAVLIDRERRPRRASR
jgi:HEAT repeat protein